MATNRRSGFFALCQAWLGIELGGKVHSTSAPAAEVPQAQELWQRNASTSPLLLLPAEIRNMIYDYALIYEGGLINDQAFDNKSGATGRFFSADDQDKKRDPKSFKRVCRQLFMETVSMVLESNNVTFCGNGATNNLYGRATHRAFKSFLNDECSIFHQVLLANVTIECDVLYLVTRYDNDWSRFVGAVAFWGRNKSFQGFVNLTPSATIRVNYIMPSPLGESGLRRSCFAIILAGCLIETLTKNAIPAWVFTCDTGGI